MATVDGWKVSLKRLYSLRGNTFIFAFCSRWQFKSCYLLFQHLYQFEWHNRVGSFKCHKYCKHMIQPEPAVKQKHRVFKTWHLLSSGRAHCSNTLRVFRTGNEQLVPAQPAERARLYLREVIPLIYKTPKQSFLPPRFPGAIPFKKDMVFYTGLTCTHGTRRKTNRGHLNINHPSVWMEELLLSSTRVLELRVRPSKPRIRAQAWEQQQN